MNKLKKYKLGLEGWQWTDLAEDLCDWLPGPTSGSSQLSANPAPEAVTPSSSLSRHLHSCTHRHTHNLKIDLTNYKLTM